MTEPLGFADAVSRFSTELDAAVVRARRVAAENRETSTKFRRETKQLAEQVRAGAHQTKPTDLTSDNLRKAATEFRTDRGLAVPDLPSGAALLAGKPTPEPAQPKPPVVLPEPDQDGSILVGAPPPAPPRPVPAPAPEPSAAQPTVTPVIPPVLPVTPAPARITGSGRRVPPPSDDDEDFSQEQIMR